MQSIKDIKESAEKATSLLDQEQSFRGLSKQLQNVYNELVSIIDICNHQTDIDREQVKVINLEPLDLDWNGLESTNLKHSPEY